jgi:response regulator RpfG family c-di-GMP phosphodiesterase
VNCEEIIEDYALLMAAIEESAEGKYSSVEELKNIEQEVDEEVQEVVDMGNKNTEHRTQCVASKNKNISNIVGVVAGLIGAFMLGMASRKIVSRR